MVLRWEKVKIDYFKLQTCKQKSLSVPDSIMIRATWIFNAIDYNYARCMHSCIPCHTLMRALITDRNFKKVTSVCFNRSLKLSPKQHQRFGSPGLHTTSVHHTVQFNKGCRLQVLFSFTFITLKGIGGLVHLQCHQLYHGCQQQHLAVLRQAIFWEVHIEQRRELEEPGAKAVDVVLVKSAIFHLQNAQRWLRSGDDLLELVVTLSQIVFTQVQLNQMLAVNGTWQVCHVRHR